MTFDFQEGTSSNYEKNNGLEFVGLYEHSLNLFPQKRFLQQQTYKYAGNEADRIENWNCICWHSDNKPLEPKNKIKDGRISHLPHHVIVQNS